MENETPQFMLVDGWLMKLENSKCWNKIEERGEGEEKENMKEIECVWERDS